MPYVTQCFDAIGDLRDILLPEDVFQSSVPLSSTLVCELGRSCVLRLYFNL